MAHVGKFVRTERRYAQNYAAVRDGYKLDKTRREFGAQRPLRSVYGTHLHLAGLGSPEDGNCFGDTLVD